MITYRLTLATEATRDLVVEALRAASSVRTRVASKAALVVAEDKLAKRDVRSAAVRVAGLLAEAAQLGALADELAAADAIPILEFAVAAEALKPVDLTRLDDPTPLDVPAMSIGTDVATGEGITPLEEHVIEATAAGDLDDLDEALVEELGDDGLSPAAHAALAQAQEFAATYLSDPEDPTLDTGALAEDDELDPSDTDALEEGLKA